MASYNRSVISIEDAQSNLEGVIALAVKFNFEIRNLIWVIDAAAKCAEVGDDQGAVSLIMELISDTRRKLVRFFQNSPERFGEYSCEVQCKFKYGLDTDLQERLTKAFREVEAYSKLQVGIDLYRAAELYTNALEMLRVVEREQKARLENREKRKEAARLAQEALHVREQQELERQRRMDKASKLRNLIPSVAQPSSSVN